MAPLNLEKIRLAWNAALIYEPVLESTNTTALERCRSGAVLPLLVLADRQLGGRGQYGRTWWSGPGSLTFSVAFHAASTALPASLIPLAAAQAVAALVAVEAPASRVQIKWPNDVLREGRKVCGILCEQAAAPAAFVVGVGVNLQRSPESPPPEILSRIGWIDDNPHSAIDRTDFLIRVLRAFTQSLQQSSRPHMLESFRARCCLTDKMIRATGTPWGDVRGICRGIDDDGRLLLELDDQQRVALQSAQIEWIP